MLKLYHAEPAANSLKAMIYLYEKELPFESRYVDLHKFEQHEPWFVAINPEGQVPVLDDDGEIITHTTVIGEYLEDRFPNAPRLRPNTPAGNARVRYWNKFVDEHVMNYVSMWGWHRMVGVIARGIESGEFEKLVERIGEGPRPRHRQDRGGGGQGRGAARQDQMDRQRRIFARRRKFLFDVRHGDRAHVPGDRQRQALSAPVGLGRPHDRAARRQEGARDAEQDQPSTAHLHRRGALNKLVSGGCSLVGNMLEAGHECRHPPEAG
jgi:glutathione S-transferase